jgi:hypothetical protein
MKFYLEYATQIRPLRRAHLLSNENNPKGDCLCNITINLEKGEILEQLPEDAYLCPRGEPLASVPGRRHKYRKALKLRPT